jgi:uncharacterized oxidoreductase
MDHTIDSLTLTAFVSEIFHAAGCGAAEARCIAGHLVTANLTGHDSHGVARVPRYVAWLKDGLVRAGQKISIVTEGPTHAVVDGNLGFGQTIGEQVVDVGIAKARVHGMAVVALRNTGHIGRIGDWAERAAEAGLISIHFVNVGMGELVAPFGGVDRRFSTNPFCVGAPMPEGPPLLLDMATSVVAEGKVLVAANGGKKLPEGALIGPDGKLSTDPVTLYGPIEGHHVRDPANGTGALRAFGEHKGSGIAFMCEILAGCLTGNGTSGPIPGGKRKGISNGMLSIYLRPGAFAAEHFVEAARDYAGYVKSARPAQPGGEVLVPGEPETRMRAQRLRDGIPLQANTWASILATAKSLGLQAPA